MDTPNDQVHIPVLLTSVLGLAAIRPGMSVVDATLVGGGYTLALLEAVGPQGRVMAFDWDKQAIEGFLQNMPSVAKQAFEEKRLVLVPESYSTLREAMARSNWQGAHVIVADLGLSSIQLDDPMRGLSFQKDGPLDMRLSSHETVTAADIVNTWSEESLGELFRVYADEGESERIAHAIVLTRKKEPIFRTGELAELVRSNVVVARRRAKIHPATKVFQALRMAVNSEREHLQSFLRQGLEQLFPAGKFLVVTFHSGEDVLVKQIFRELSQDGQAVLLTKKPLQPNQEEIIANPRSRSAKLRGIQKLVSNEESR